MEDWSRQHRSNHISDLAHVISLTKGYCLLWLELKRVEVTCCTGETGRNQERLIKTSKILQSWYLIFWKNYCVNTDVFVFYIEGDLSSSSFIGEPNLQDYCQAHPASFDLSVIRIEFNRTQTEGACSWKRKKTANWTYSRHFVSIFDFSWGIEKQAIEISTVKSDLSQRSSNLELASHRSLNSLRRTNNIDLFQTLDLMKFTAFESTFM